MKSYFTCSSGSHALHVRRLTFYGSSIWQFSRAWNNLLQLGITAYLDFHKVLFKWRRFISRGSAWVPHAALNFASLSAFRLVAKSSGADLWKVCKLPRGTHSTKFSITKFIFFNLFRCRFVSIAWPVAMTIVTSRLLHLTEKNSLYEIFNYEFSRLRFKFSNGDVRWLIMLGGWRSLKAKCPGDEVESEEYKLYVLVI
jgi:hypothetical protein